MKPSRRVPTLLAAATAMAILTFGSLPSALAQPDDCPCAGRGDPAARVDQRLQHLTSRLGLDARQVSRVRGILQEHARRAVSVRALPRGPDKRHARDDLRTWTHAQIRAVLTPAQQSTFDSMRAERRRHHGRGRGHGAGDGPGRGGDA